MIFATTNAPIRNPYDNIDMIAPSSDYKNTAAAAAAAAAAAGTVPRIKTRQRQPQPPRAAGIRSAKQHKEQGGFSGFNI
jgi:hypothetical protein